MKCYSYNLLFWLTKSESWENQGQLRPECCCPTLQSSPAPFCLGRTSPAYMVTDAGQQGLRVASTLAFCPSQYLLIPLHQDQSKCLTHMQCENQSTLMQPILLPRPTERQLGVLLHWLWEQCLKAGLLEWLWPPKNTVLLLQTPKS